MSEEFTVRPAGHRIAVKIDEHREKTEGGIIIPAKVRDSRTHEGKSGTLIAVGSQAWKAFADGTPWAKIGDRVLCIKYAGADWEETPGVMYMNDEDIMGVIVPKQDSGV